MIEKPMNEEEYQRLVFMINEKFRYIVNGKSMEIAELLVSKNFPDGIITEKEIIAQIDLKIEKGDIKRIMDKIKSNPLSTDHIK